MRPHRRQPTRLLRPWDSPGKNTGAGCHFLLQCMKVKSESEVAQSCLTLRDPMDCSPPGSSIHGIFQARVLEWVASAFSEWNSYIITNNVLGHEFIEEPPRGNRTLLAILKRASLACFPVKFTYGSVIGWWSICMVHNQYTEQKLLCWPLSTNGLIFQVRTHETKSKWRKITTSDTKEPEERTRLILRKIKYNWLGTQASFSTKSSKTTT